MAKKSLLIDTDIWIDYFNVGRFAPYFEGSSFTIYYSTITEKELLTKKGLRDAEKDAIVRELRLHRRINITPSIAKIYSFIRGRHKSLEKEDALIAASAIAKRLPLFTRNWKHFRIIHGLQLFEG